MQSGTNHTLQASNASHHTATMASSTTFQRQPQVPQSGATVARTSNNANDRSDEDDDGGVHAAEIARKKQEVEDKKKKKEESKKKKEKIVAFDDEDEDGAIISPKPKVKPKPIKTKKKSGFSLCFRHDDENEDEDGGVSKQKIAAAEKKKQAAEEKKKKKVQEKAIKTKVAEDDDEDDDGGSKQTASAKETKDASNKVPEIEVEDEDEDGGRIVKTYDTVKVIMSSKRPVLHNQSSKTEPSADNTDEEKVKPSKREKTTAPASYDTISKIVLKPSHPAEKRKPKDSTSDFHFEPIPSDEETSDPSVTTDSSTSNTQSTNANKVNLLRSRSYRQAQGRSPPTVTRRSKVFSSIQKQSIANDEDNDDLKITTNEDQPAVNNLVYAAVVPVAS